MEKCIINELVLWKISLHFVEFLFVDLCFLTYLLMIGWITLYIYIYIYIYWVFDDKFSFVEKCIINELGVSFVYTSQKS